MIDTVHCYREYQLQSQYNSGTFHIRLSCGLVWQTVLAGGWHPQGDDGSVLFKEAKHEPKSEHHAFPRGSALIFCSSSCPDSEDGLWIKVWDKRMLSSPSCAHQSALSHEQKSDLQERALYPLTTLHATQPRLSFHCAWRGLALSTWNINSYCHLNSYCR